MEAFSLLKYWRGGGTNTFPGGRTAVSTTTTTTTTTTITTDSFSSSSSSSSASTTTIVTALSPRSSDDNDDDDGPFFDLQFTQLPEEAQIKEKKPEKQEVNDKKQTISETINIINLDDDDDEEDDNDDDEEEEEEEEANDQNMPIPPPASDENLFFKGSFVPIEPSSLLEGNAKLPTSLSKSAAKFRVLMLKFKKSKENIASDDISSIAVTEKENHHSRKFFTVKFIKDSRKAAKSVGNISNADDDNDKDDEENKFLKDVMQKYLKMVKPLHSIRISKLKFSGQLMSFSGTAEVKAGAEATAEVAAGSNLKSLKKAGNLSTGLGLRVVCKHLGKSKSASLATVGTPAAVAVAPSASRRRDDSLLQQQDGIQSAILHCKRSFNASRDAEISILSRSASDPSNEKSSGLSTVTCCSSEEAKGG